jgi:hypothetical protein
MHDLISGIVIGWILGLISTQMYYKEKNENNKKDK